MREKSNQVFDAAFRLSRITHHVSRIIQPELLDQLPETDPAAVRSRRDLRRVNCWMGNAGKAARAINAEFARSKPRKVLELGAGDGIFFLRVAELLGPAWKGSQVILLDRQQLVSPETQALLQRLGWHVEALQSDVFEALDAQQDCDIILANLFLHHFSDLRLKEMLRFVAQRASLFVAVEPRRSVQSLLFSRLLWFIGCNHVTRHDAVVSVQAGFRGKELSSLWPTETGWLLREGRSGQFSHVFVAAKMGALTNH
jgi:hypothetical protein